ncbi:hypothetical protein [Sulfitobacter donghicola]|uniref:Uncharacterized protein n=1 Tax=Sulfitobacter donghicola DSW-25 = KCTC 12864 = JCM 14565 TaxID=1300350 RepID=A0A073IRD4_9RHOB|nr:hypothetical protein [Sulfitobacter donghicola]KEJ87962.1 hypothetical protein DSW25_04365 [Sulfitobacter donghicola DSW-25 = KCTC 12864 = JCM 14565]KIN66511.1 hypothetical protein Z948_208 [Sulfitobacter donghicola DSW-25 = KCTC 12864 = JCM 14565]
MNRASGGILIILAGLVLGYVGISQWLGTLDRYGAAGCVIAPDAERPLRAKVARALGQAHDEGDWLVIGPKLCTITFPDIETPISAKEPDVAVAISAVDEYAEHGDIGCFISRDLLEDSLKLSRGWDEDQVFRAYIQMMAAGVMDGSWQFFGESPLRTPVSFQYLGGTCGEVPNAAKMANSHEVLKETFDSFIRANAPYVPCGEGGNVFQPQWAEVYKGLGSGDPVNAWYPLEIMFVGLAAEWVEGATHDSKGFTRPPLCSFQGDAR